jgi:RNA polymerase sigma-70 factor, ECF subfamily
MDRAIAIDRWAIDEYRDYLRLLARIHLSPRLHAKIDASDIAQQAVLQAHANRSQFHGQTEAEWLAWLRTILANTITATGRRYGTESRDLDRERSLDAELQLSASRLECALAADQTSPSQAAIRTEELLRLAKAMAGLSEDERKVIELHHLGGLQVSEVAELLNRSRSAVVGLLYRGLKRLRIALDGKERKDGST